MLLALRLSWTRAIPGSTWASVRMFSMADLSRQRGTATRQRWDSTQSSARDARGDRPRTPYSRTPPGWPGPRRHFTTRWPRHSTLASLWARDSEPRTPWCTGPRGCPGTCWRRCSCRCRCHTPARSSVASLDTTARVTRAVRIVHRVLREGAHVFMGHVPLPEHRYQLLAELQARVVRKQG